MLFHLALTFCASHPSTLSLIADGGFKEIPLRRTSFADSSHEHLYRRESDKATLFVYTVTFATIDLAKAGWERHTSGSAAGRSEPKMLPSGKGIGEVWGYHDTKGGSGIMLNFLSNKFIGRAHLQYFGSQKDGRVVWDDRNLELDRKLIEAIGRQLIVEQRIKP